MQRPFARTIVHLLRDVHWKRNPSTVSLLSHCFRFRSFWVFAAVVDGLKVDAGSGVWGLGFRVA